MSEDSAQQALDNMFFDPRRYDLAHVGRYKFNKKLHLKNRVVGFTLAEDVVDKATGEIIAQKGSIINEALAIKIQNAAVRSITLQTEEKNEKVLSNLMVDIDAYVKLTDKGKGRNRPYRDGLLSCT